MTEQQAVLQKMAMEHQATVKQMEDTYTKLRVQHFQLEADYKELLEQNFALRKAMRLLLKRPM